MKPSVQFFLVCAPGVDPEGVDVKPDVVKLGWGFAKMDRGDLIDQAKLVDEHISALEKWCEAARGVLKQTLDKPNESTPETITQGKVYEAHYIRVLRVDVDRDKVRTLVGPDRYIREFCKHSEVFQLKIVPIPQTPGVAEVAVV